MVNYGKPVRIFVNNLRRWGYEVSVNENGQLVVTQPVEVETPPVLADEIRKRAAQIVELVELEHLLNRPLTQADADRCRNLAERCGVELDWQRIELDKAT